MEQNGNPVENRNDTKGSHEYGWYIRTRNIVYYILGIIEVLLLLRLLFKLLGANPFNSFASFIYTLSGILAAPFAGIFRTVTTKGVETVSVFEPSTVIAMIIYAVIAQGIVKLVRLRIAEETLG